MSAHAMGDGFAGRNFVAASGTPSAAGISTIRETVTAAVPCGDRVGISNPPPGEAATAPAMSSRASPQWLHLPGALPVDVSVFVAIVVLVPIVVVSVALANEHVANAVGVSRNEIGSGAPERHRRGLRRHRWNRRI